MDENFFEPLDGYVAKFDNKYSACVQIQNISGTLLRVAEGFYLRNYSFALISKDNKNIDKFLKARKIKIHNFSVSKAPKKKKQVDEIRDVAETEEQKTTNVDIENLSSMFTMGKDNKNQDKI